MEIFEFTFFTPPPSEGGTKKQKKMKLVLEPKLLNTISFTQKDKKTRLISIVSKPNKIVVVVVVIFVQKRYVQKTFGWVQYWAQFWVQYWV